MGFLSQAVERSNLEVGDHIYTWRAAFIYSHHGIYVGGDKVVHFTSNPSSSLSLSSSSSSSCVSAATCLDLPNCGFRKSGSGVIMSCLNCFLENGSLRCYEYGVSWFVFIAKLLGGTCTNVKSDPSEDVIHRAMYLFHNGFREYNLFKNNCEDFALYCKTGLLVSGGLGGSGQVASAIGTTLAFGRIGRSLTHIGFRSDATKVEVEKIAEFHGN